MPANPLPALRVHWNRFWNDATIQSWLYGLLVAAILLTLPWWLPVRLGAHAYWPYWLGIIPAVLIFLQSLYLLRLPKPELADPNAPQPGRGRRAAAQAELAGREEAKLAIDTELRWTRVVLEYAPPIAANLLAGMLVAFMVDQLAIAAPEDGNDQLTYPLFDGPAFEGAVYGALGAYIYVLMMLGQRTYQRDITPGAAVWSAVQLFLGPLLGGLLATILEETVQVQHYTRAVIYFFAGLSPREIVQFVQAAVRRFFEAPPTLRRMIPLQQIRGIDARVEERLYEEGISNVHLLAVANPVRLYRSTPYDLRQVLIWIDECILYTALPEHAETLQKLGLTGAIDLAYYWTMWNEPQPVPPETPPRRRTEAPQPESTEPQPGRSHAAESIELIAKRIGMEKALLLDVSRRLNEDTQLRLIWSLYQAFESSDPDPDHEDGGQR